MAICLESTSSIINRKDWNDTNKNFMLRTSEKCDDDENKKGVKMAIFSNDVQLILYCGCLSSRLGVYGDI